MLREYLNVAFVGLCVNGDGDGDGWCEYMSVSESWFLIDT